MGGAHSPFTNKGGGIKQKRVFDSRYPVVTFMPGEGHVDLPMHFQAFGFI